MINIIINYKDPNTPPEKVKASYTKVRGNFFCIHFMTTKDGPFRSKYIPSDVIDFIEQEDSGKKSKDSDDNYKFSGESD